MLYHGDSTRAVAHTRTAVSGVVRADKRYRDRAPLRRARPARAARAR